MRKKLNLGVPDKTDREYIETAEGARLKWWQTALTWLLRIVIGGVFIFSGIAKAIDPWGTLYKMQDYVAALDFGSWASPSLLLTGVFFLFTLEFMVGIYLLTGSFRRFAPVMTLLFMLVMLPLTLWIAIKNPVADCGCFGDAWHISNWATFWKNVFITLAGVWLLLYNRRVHWLVTPALQWIGFVITGLYAVIIGLAGYWVQPIVDFRPYKTGGPIVTADADSEEHFTFVYEKNGVRKEFSETDELPDEESGWQFVERKSATPVKTKTAGQQLALRVWDPYDDEDVTADVVGSEGDRQILVMIPSLNDVSIASTSKINYLKEWADAHNVDMIAVVSGSPKDIERWKDISMAEYPVYAADDTAIKEAVRGNPGVIYTVDGKIQWKSTLMALRADKYELPDSSDDAATFYRDVTPQIHEITVIYICAYAVLIMFSFGPSIIRGSFAAIRRRRHTPTAGNHDVSGDDTAPRSE